MGKLASSTTLKDAAKKEFSEDIKKKYEEQFPLVRTVKYKCQQHKAGCCCMNDNFLTTAKVNNFCCFEINLKGKGYLYESGGP